MNIYIGADHRGFELKEMLKPWLSGLGHTVTDCGSEKLDPNDDYPDVAFAVAEKTVADAESRGIVLCGSGVGVTIAANKVKGARASTGISVDEVVLGRRDDDMNILAISANYTNESMVKSMVEVFLATPFAADERHVRRLDKIKRREGRG